MESHPKQTCNLANRYMENTPRAAPRLGSRTLPATPGASFISFLTIPAPAFSTKITLMMTYSKLFVALLSGFIPRVINIPIIFLYRNSSIYEKKKVIYKLFK